MDRAQGLFGQRNLFSSHLLRQANYGLQARSSLLPIYVQQKQFYVFKWLGGKSKRDICDLWILHEIHISRFLSFTGIQPQLCFLWLPLCDSGTMAEVSSCDIPYGLQKLNIYELSLYTEKKKKFAEPHSRVEYIHILEDTGFWEL